MSEILTSERVATELSEKARKMARTPMEVWGIPWGLPALDKLTGGIHEHEMTVMMGRPGNGKTSFLSLIALNVANWVKVNRPKQVVRLVLCEQTAHQFQMRMACMFAEVSANNVRSGATQAELAKYERALMMIGNLPIEYLDTPKSLDATSDWLAEGGNCAWWALDYLTIHPLSAESRTMHPTAKADALSQGFRLVAKTTAPGFVLSQMNREVEKREDQRPRLPDLRASGQVEQDAANVFGLWNKPTTTQAAVDAELLILKHREGPLGKVDLLFLPQYTRFIDTSKHPDDQEFKPEFTLPPLAPAEPRDLADASVLDIAELEL